MKTRDEKFITEKLMRLPRNKFSVGEKTKQRIWQRVMIHLRNNRATQAEKQPGLSARFGWLNALLTILIVVAISGIAGFAAADSIPGDFLYPVKTGVLERAERAATFTNKEQKIKVLSTQSKRRLAEVNTLVEENRATEAVVTQTLGTVATNNQQVVAITEDKPELIEEAQDLAEEITQGSDIVLATLEESEASGKLEADVKKAVQEGISESAKHLTKLKNTDGDGKVDGVATEEETTPTETEEGSSDETITNSATNEGEESDEDTIESQIQIEHVIEGENNDPEGNDPIIITEPQS